MPIAFSLSTSSKIIKITPLEHLVFLGCLNPEEVAAVLQVAPVKLAIPGFVFVPREYEADARLALKLRGVK